MTSVRELPEKLPGTGAAKSPRGYARWHSTHLQSLPELFHDRACRFRPAGAVS